MTSIHLGQHIGSFYHTTMILTLFLSIIFKKTLILVCESLCQGGGLETSRLTKNNPKKEVIFLK